MLFSKDSFRNDSPIARCQVYFHLNNSRFDGVLLKFLKIPLFSGDVASLTVIRMCVWWMTLNYFINVKNHFGRWELITDFFACSPAHRALFRWQMLLPRLEPAQGQYLEQISTFTWALVRFEIITMKCRLILLFKEPFLSGMIKLFWCRLIQFGFRHPTIN